ncbi:MAG: hypothetical protein CMJ52_07605 [Planctomycetaceae bacterium]|nr:hypothetical protein [Planctomycetaceae bacterium]
MESYPQLILISPKPVYLLMDSPLILMLKLINLRLISMSLYQALILKENHQKLILMLILT